jgi:hypothetical protein
MTPGGLEFPQTRRTPSPVNSVVVRQDLARSRLHQLKPVWVPGASATEMAAYLI